MYSLQLSTDFKQSFLGMNITETSAPLIPSSSSIPSNNSQTNSTQSNSTHSNSTQSNSSADDATQRLWDLRWFAILSVPLLFATIILPLIAGPLVRWLLQTYLRFRKFWRFALPVTVVVYIICYYVLSEGEGGVVIGLVLFSICDVSVILIGGVRALRTRGTKGKRVRWWMFVTFSIGCLAADAVRVYNDVFRPDPFLLGFVAWGVLFSLFLYSYWEEWVAMRPRTSSSS